MEKTNTFQACWMNVCEWWSLQYVVLMLEMRLLVLPDTFLCVSAAWSGVGGGSRLSFSAVW